MKDKKSKSKIAEKPGKAEKKTFVEQVQKPLNIPMAKMQQKKGQKK